MASISLNKGNGKYKVMLTKEELNTLTVALALLSIPDMEDEAVEQGLDFKELEYSHLKMFDKFTKVTKLYPQKPLTSIVIGDENIIINASEITINGKDN